MIDLKELLIPGTVASIQEFATVCTALRMACEALESISGIHVVDLQTKSEKSGFNFCH